MTTVGEHEFQAVRPGGARVSCARPGNRAPEFSGDWGAFSGCAPRGRRNLERGDEKKGRPFSGGGARCGGAIA
jgi:hypothetical protein